jgi:hypothetical protein
MVLIAQEAINRQIWSPWYGANESTGWDKMFLADFNLENGKLFIFLLLQTFRKYLFVWTKWMKEINFVE